MYASLHLSTTLGGSVPSYVGGGTLSVSQTASRSSNKPTRAEPMMLHASINININIASIIIFKSIDIHVFIST